MGAGRQPMQRWPASSLGCEGSAEPVAIRRRANRELALVARDGHRDHVLLDHFAEPDAGIVSLGDDIEFLVGHGDVDLDLRIGLGKRRQERACEKALRDR